jgi:hypothetical protein
VLDVPAESRKSMEGTLTQADSARDPFAASHGQLLDRSTTLSDIDDNMSSTSANIIGMLQPQCSED